VPINRRVPTLTRPQAVTVSESFLHIFPADSGSESPPVSDGHGHGLRWARPPRPARRGPLPGPALVPRPYQSADPRTKAYVSYTLRVHWQFNLRAPAHRTRHTVCTSLSDAQAGTDAAAAPWQAQEPGRSIANLTD
jgi:hypothetical protein